MKYRYILLAIIAPLLMLNTGCSEEVVDATPDVLELQLLALKNDNVSWNTEGGSVFKDGYDVSDQFNGFVLNISEFNYTTQNSVNTAWPASGSWQFNNDNPNEILRSDGVLIDVNLNNKTLILKFNVDGTSGRVNGISGEFTFTLSGN